MIARSDDQHRLLCWGFLTLIALVILVSNYPHILIETVPTWYRIAEPTLLAIGLMGTVLKSRPLRFVGWIGICLFVLAVPAAMPDLDHADPALRGFPTLWRLALTIGIWIALAICFWKLRSRLGEQSEYSSQSN